MTFGNRIQHLRKEKGLSQESLAEKLAVTRQTISKWELDQSTPDLNFISQLSDILNISTDYLIKGTAPENKCENISVVQGFSTQADCETKSQNNKTAFSGISFPSMVFITGIVLMCIGAIGIMIFIIMSSLHPWIHSNEHGTFTGLLGFLLGNNFTGLFFALCAVCLFGLLCIICAMIIRRMQNK